MSRFTSIAITLFCGVLLVSPLMAQENTYPGNMCVEVQTGTSLDERQKVIRDEEGQFFNGSPTHTLEVVCPVSGLYNDLSGGSANVFVTDRHPSEDVCCEARANNVGAFAHSDTVCSEDTDNRVQTLAMTPPTVNFTFTSRYFYCKIPPTYRKAASGIRLYRH